VPDTLEAEVLEIDGSPPPPQPEPEAPRRDDPWQAMRGRVVVAAVVIVLRVIGGFLRLLTGAGGGGRTGTSLSRPD
jgi:hypothetical protein